MDAEIFENHDFKVEASEQSGCRLSVRATIKPKATQKAYQKAVKLVNKQISIPGFRKGHAPDKAVVARYASYVEQEWKEIVVNEAYRAALDLTKIYPLNKDTIDKPRIESCSQEEGAVVALSYEHYPQVPTIAFSQIQLPSIEKKAIEQAQIEDVLEEVRRSKADWEDISDREVQEGDFVDVSIDSIQEDPPKPIVKDRRFEVADKRISPWLKNLLLGLQIGQSVEGESTVDPDADDDIKNNFIPTKVRITLHAIKKIILPEINDAFAKSVGADSIDDLKDKIRTNLEKEAQQEQQQKLTEALEDALLATYHFDLPASLVESERKERITKKIQALKTKNVSDEEISAREKEIESEVTNEIDEALRLYFINKQIAKQGQISLSNQELNDEIVRYISQNPYLYNNETDPNATRELVSRMASVLMQRKTREYALSQVGASVYTQTT